MCFKFRKKEYVNREEIVNAIIELQKDELRIETEVLEANLNIAMMFEKGKKEEDRVQKIFYAKKINYLKQEVNSKSNRGLFILYNLQLLTKIKEIIDDNQMVKKIEKLYTNDLLKNQKKLAIYLNSLLNRKIKTEDILTQSDSMLVNIQNKFKDNIKIYGIESDSNEDELLSMFELDSIEEMSKNPEIGLLNFVSEED